MSTHIDPLAHRVARRHQAEEAAQGEDLMVARVVARYLAWADGALADVEDEDEFPRFGGEEDGQEVSEPAGTPPRTDFRPPKLPRKKS